MTLAVSFNRSWLGRSLASPPGRVFRLVAGAAFVALGIGLAASGATPLGAVTFAWGALAMHAGGFDLCYVSFVLGGPLRGAAARAQGTARQSRS